MSQRKTRHIVQGYCPDGQLITINTAKMIYLWLPVTQADQTFVDRDSVERGVGVALGEVRAKSPAEDLKWLKRCIVKRVF